MFGEAERNPYYKLKGMPDQYGYHAVTMRLNGRVKITRIHRMVLNTFVGPKPAPNMQGAHGDGRKENNSLRNLRWATVRSNSDDKISHGSHKGERNSGAKLLTHQVREILEYVKHRGYRKILAVKYGVSEVLIKKIRARKVWAHLIFP